MFDFLKRNKVFILVTLSTCAVIIGGLYFLSSSGSSQNQTSSNTVNDAILIDNDSYKTSGLVDGVYLPASSSATVTLVEFGDFECPACALYEPVINQILTSFPGKIIFMFRNYPLPQHTNALISSYALEAAGMQGKYWEMYSKLYSSQSEWASLSDPRNVLVNYAKDLGLNTDQFTADMNSKTVKDIVSNDENDGRTIGINETPTFYLNGKKVNLSGDRNQLFDLIQSKI